ncbi:hypothetical protein [Enterobacter bugandensis]|uniref:hypothetical protein n=1 Tax=Enterobacter bugandensis TaxID=881260 RepID=UPI001C9908F3|nr:hypothetical protein [Enterobacter bugandensis]MBY6290713.1 hypothetical protein [Enterobacter bugandensis]
MKTLIAFLTALLMLITFHWIRYLFVVAPILLAGRLFGGASVISVRTLGVLLGPAGWIVAIMCLVFSRELGIVNAWKAAKEKVQKDSQNI